MGEKEKQFFDQTPGFLDAIQRITKKGFFVKFKGEVEEFGSGLFSVHIEGKGLVPTEPRYSQRGIGLFMDPTTTVERLGDLIRQREPKFQIQHLICNVNTIPWNLYDEQEANIIGRKGWETSVTLIVVFEPRTANQ